MAATLRHIIDIMDIDRMRQLAGVQEQQVTEARDATNALMTMMDEGILDPRQVADACLGYFKKFIQDIQ